MAEGVDSLNEAWQKKLPMWSIKVELELAAVACLGDFPSRSVNEGGVL